MSHSHSDPSSVDRWPAENGALGRRPKPSTQVTIPIWWSPCRLHLCQSSLPYLSFYPLRRLTVARYFRKAFLPSAYSIATVSAPRTPRGLRWADSAQLGLPSTQHACCPQSPFQPSPGPPSPSFCHAAHVPGSQAACPSPAAPRRELPGLSWSRAPGPAGQGMGGGPGACWSEWWMPVSAARTPTPWRQVPCVTDLHYAQLVSSLVVLNTVFQDKIKKY